MHQITLFQGDEKKYLVNYENFKSHFLSSRKWMIPGMICKQKSTKTSSAWSATLENTSWDRLIIQLGLINTRKKSLASSCKLELARFSTLLRIHDRIKCGKGGGTPHRKQIYWKGGHRTYLIEVGTLHIPYWGGDTAHTLLGWGHRT